LLNFDNVVDAMGLMLHDNAYGLSKRRVTLSTSGVVPMIDRLAMSAMSRWLFHFMPPMMSYAMS